MRNYVAQNGMGEIHSTIDFIREMHGRIRDGFCFLRQDFEKNKLTVKKIDKLNIELSMLLGLYSMFANEDELKRITIGKDIDIFNGDCQEEYNRKLEEIINKCKKKY